MTTWTVFATGSPGNPNNDDGTAYTLHTGWRINQAGSFWCVGVEWFTPTTLPPGDVIVGLFARVDDATSGGILAQKTVAASSLTPGARNQIFFDPGDEVAVSQADVNGFYASVFTPSRYASTGSYFGADDIVGPITAWSNGSVGGNGRFFAGGTGLTYPNGQFAAGGYWMSPIITDEDPGGATDLNLTDRSGPVLLGGSPDRLLADLVWTDRSGPVLAGGSADALASVLLLPDRSGPTFLGGSTDRLVQDLVLADRSGPTLAGGSPAVFTEQPVEPLELQDQLGSGVLAGGSPDALTIAEASGDLSVWPMLVQALACLENAADTLPSPPKYRSIRGGGSVVAGIDPTTDECCEGLAWVRVVSISPTADFPTPASGYQPCPAPELAVELELGIVRCSPYFAGGQNDALLPTTAMHLAAVQAVMADAAALRTAACCLAAQRTLTIGTWSPVENEANCTGGTLRVTVAVPFCERTC